MLLLMACWKGDGRIPNEDGRLAAITRLPVKRWKLGGSRCPEDFLHGSRTTAVQYGIQEKNGGVARKGSNTFV